MFSAQQLLTMAAGGVLLVAGRRLYWLLVGLVGFVIGFRLAADFLEGPGWLILAGGLAAGFVASGLAVFFQRIAVAIAGFLIGGLAVLWIADQAGGGQPWWVWALALVAALVGVQLTRSVFEMALIVLSSILGATLVLEAWQGPVGQPGLWMLVLVAGGILIQFIGRRGERQS